MHIERLFPNGFYRVTCRRSGLVALFDAHKHPRNSNALLAAFKRAVAGE